MIEEEEEKKVQRKQESRVTLKIRSPWAKTTTQKYEVSPERLNSTVQDIS